MAAAAADLKRNKSATEVAMAEKILGSESAMAAEVGLGSNSNCLRRVEGGKMGVWKEGVKATTGVLCEPRGRPG